MYKISEVISSKLIIPLGNFLTISNIYFPETTTSPNSSIDSISDAGIKVLIFI